MLRWNFLCSQFVTTTPSPVTGQQQKEYGPIHLTLALQTPYVLIRSALSLLSGRWYGKFSSPSAAALIFYLFILGGMIHLIKLSSGVASNLTNATGVQHKSRHGTSQFLLFHITKLGVYCWEKKKKKKYCFLDQAHWIDRWLSIKPVLRWHLEATDPDPEKPTCPFPLLEQLVWKSYHLYACVPSCRSFRRAACSVLQAYCIPWA